MAEYDFKSAKRYIQMHSDLIGSAVMGIHEDWCWTAEIVFDDGSFTKNLDQDDLKIGGIAGSFWGTPTLEITFKDGSEKRMDCFTGETSGQKPEWFSLGCLSQPVQDARENKLTLIKGEG